MSEVMPTASLHILQTILVPYDCWQSDEAQLGLTLISGARPGLEVQVGTYLNSTEHDALVACGGAIVCAVESG